MISTIILQKVFWTECNNNKSLRVEWNYSAIKLTNRIKRTCIRFFHLLKEVQNCSIVEPERTTRQSIISNTFLHQSPKTLTIRVPSFTIALLIKTKVILAILITFTIKKCSLLKSKKLWELCMQVMSILEDWLSWRMHFLILIF